MSKGFGMYMETAKNLNNTFAAFQRMEPGFRHDFYQHYVEALLNKSPHIVACWVDFDRNALDGRDEQFENIDIFPSSARFFALTYLDDANKVVFQHENPEAPVETYLADEWLKAPRELKKNYNDRAVSLVLY